MKATACAILALLAVAAIAQTADAAFCRTSSYKVAANLAKTNKEAMYKACLAGKEISAAPTIYKVETKPDGCTLVYQKVASAAAWDAYSSCEKSTGKINNAALYTPLHSMADPCMQYAKKGNC